MFAEFPELRDPPSPTTTCSSSPPTLDTSTLALLDDFLSTKAQEEARLNELALATASLTTSDDEDAEGEDDSAPATPPKPKMMSVDEYQAAFGEDWQLSQFWCALFRMRPWGVLTRPIAPSIQAIYGLVQPSSTIAFMCCPTAYVGFQHEYAHEGARLLEFDPRFELLGREQYVRYDLNEPEKLPSSIRGKVDVAVVDPPFLNEDTNAKAIDALKLLLAPGAKLLLLTGVSTEAILERLYTEPPVGPLVKTALEVEHGSGLANDFACWGNWPEAKDLGRDIDDDNDKP
ncbi:putative N6-adenine methyltransferase-domain-containing protein [Schizophyllum commune]